MKPVIVFAMLAAIGAIVATIWVGSHVREDTVVAHPYEEGLAHDAERHGRVALGWTIELAAPPAAPGPAALTFELLDRSGAPLTGAAVALTIGRPDSGHGQFTAEARPASRGYVTDLTFPAPGPWEVRFDVTRGADRSRLTRTVSVGAAAPRPGEAAPCDLGAGPCTLALGDVEVVLELGPRPLRTMAELAVSAVVRRAGAPQDGAVVSVGFEMPGMAMGTNEVALAPAGAGRYAGRAVLVRCPSGKREWAASVVVVPSGGERRTTLVPLRVVE